MTIVASTIPHRLSLFERRLRAASHPRDADETSQVSIHWRGYSLPRASVVWSSGALDYSAISSVGNCNPNNRVDAPARHGSKSGRRISARKMKQP